MLADVPYLNQPVQGTVVLVVLTLDMEQVQQPTVATQTPAAQRMGLMELVATVRVAIAMLPVHIQTLPVAARTPLMPLVEVEVILPSHTEAEATMPVVIIRSQPTITIAAITIAMVEVEVAVADMALGVEGIMGDHLVHKVMAGHHNLFPTRKGSSGVK